VTDAHAVQIDCMRNDVDSRASVPNRPQSTTLVCMHGLEDPRCAKCCCNLSAITGMHAAVHLFTLCIRTTPSGDVCLGTFPSRTSCCSRMKPHHLGFLCWLVFKEHRYSRACQLASLGTHVLSLVTSYGLVAAKACGIPAALLHLAEPGACRVERLVNQQLLALDMPVGGCIEMRRLATHDRCSTEESFTMLQSNEHNLRWAHVSPLIRAKACGADVSESKVATSSNLGDRPHSVFDSNKHGRARTRQGHYTLGILIG
jgi:hypothetical protein